MISRRKRIWGWFFFDWASQPYNTLLLTFIFGPYVRELVGPGSEAQALWGITVGLAGIAIALLAPILGAIADQSGMRMRWIWAFSASMSSALRRSGGRRRRIRTCSSC